MYTPDSTTLKSDLIPEYEYAYFTIQDFAKFCEMDTCIYSPGFVTSGISWRLKVYSTCSSEEGHVSVYLESLSTIPQQSEYSSVISIVQFSDPDVC